MKKIHPAFLILIVLVLFWGRVNLLLVYFLALLLHECAHAFVAKSLGYKLKNLFLMPYGACLMYQEIFFEDDEFKIAIAGPLASLLAAFLTISLWWIFPFLYSFTYEFVIANFAIAFFNFLPAFPLDGARILINLLSDKMPRKKAFQITTFFNYFFSSVFTLAFLLSAFTKINFNFLIVAIFLLLGVLEGNFQAKYFAVYSIDKARVLNKGVKAQTYVFSSQTQLYKLLKKISAHKYSIFMVVFKHGNTKIFSEDSLRQMLQQVNLNLTFNDIYKQF